DPSPRLDYRSLMDLMKDLGSRWEKPTITNSHVDTASFPLFYEDDAQTAKYLSEASNMIERIAQLTSDSGSS
ncbi:hypothetical protein NEUTE1DRAFT_48682, partial [Neurospora tetrasperma FGSC 2508]